MFLNLFINLATSQFVTYGSAVQLKSLFTKNRITVEINQTSFLPAINCKRPPYNDGWYWVIEPSNETQECIRKAVLCGDYVTFHNPVFSYYITVGEQENQNIIATKLGNNEGKSDWQIVCDGRSKFWEQDSAVQFYNKKEKCYLHSDFEKIYNNEGFEIFRISCVKRFSKETQWRSAEGIYLDDQPISEMYAKSPRN